MSRSIPESWETRLSGKKQREKHMSGGFQTDMIPSDLLSVYDDPFIAAVINRRNKRHLLSLSLGEVQDLRQARSSLRSNVLRQKSSRAVIQRMHKHRFTEPKLVQDHTIYIRLDGMTMQLIGNIQPPTQKLDMRPTSLGTRKPKGVVFNVDRNSIFAVTSAIKVYASRSKTQWNHLASLLRPSEDAEDDDHMRNNIMGNAVNNYMSRVGAKDTPKQRKSLDAVAVDLYEAVSESSMQSTRTVEDTAEFLGPDFDYKSKKNPRPSLYQTIMTAMQKYELQKRAADNIPLPVKTSSSVITQVTQDDTASTCYTDALEVDSISVSTAPHSTHHWQDTTRPVQVYKPSHRPMPLQNQFKKLVPVDLFVDQKIMSQTDYHEFVLESAHSASSRRRTRSVTFSQLDLTDTDSLSSFNSFLDAIDSEWQWLPAKENNQDQNMNKSMGKLLTGTDVIKVHNVTSVRKLNNGLICPFAPIPPSLLNPVLLLEGQSSKLLALQYQLLKSKQEIAVLRAENKELKDRRRQLQAKEEDAVCNQPQTLPSALVPRIQCISCYALAVFLGLVFGQFCC